MPVVIFVTLLEQKNLILRGFSVLIHIKECIIIVDSIFKATPHNSGVRIAQ